MNIILIYECDLCLNSVWSAETTHSGDDYEVDVEDISSENVAVSRSDSTAQHSDIMSASQNCATGSGCTNGCRTSSQLRISTVSDGALCNSWYNDGSLVTLSPSSGETDTGCERSYYSTKPAVVKNGDMMTSSAGMRETAIMGDSSDEQLEKSTRNCATSLIRQPLSGTHSCRRSYDLLLSDFASRLDHGPETDILFSESASDVGRNFHASPVVETYLRLPPTSPCRKLSAKDACKQRRIDSDQSEVVEEPEVNSTRTTTMSVGCRTNSVDVISRVGVDFNTLPPSAAQNSSVADRRRRGDESKPEVRRRVTSPVDRNLVAAALNASEAQRALALANWARLRELVRQNRLPADERNFRTAASRLRELEARRSRSSERQSKRRVHRTSSMDRKRYLSVGSYATRHRCKAIDDNNDNLPFRSSSVPPVPRPANQERTELPAGSGDNVDSVGGASVDLGAGSALPYDYEPLSLAEGGGRPFSYTDDPFDYDEVAGHDGGKVTVPITICLVIIAGYIFAGAVLFTLWEDWDYLTGSYFCFITLSTIGFGDIVPGTDMDKWASSEKLVLCALYLAFGLSLLAMCFNLMQEEVKEKCKWIGLRLGLLWDDDQAPQQARLYSGSEIPSTRFGRKPNFHI